MSRPMHFILHHGFGFGKDDLAAQDRGGVLRLKLAQRRACVARKFVRPASLLPSPGTALKIFRASAISSSRSSAAAKAVP